MTAEDVEEVYALRAALDRLAATTARRTATQQHLSELDRLVDEMADEIAGAADPHRLVPPSTTRSIPPPATAG